MRRILISLAILITNLAVCSTVHSAVASPPRSSCRDQLRTDARTIAPKRDITSDDLLRLRDIGVIDGQQIGDRMFTISPDGSKIAFQLRRADPETNSYCLGIFTLDISRPVGPALLDVGGELLRYVTYNDDYGSAPSGVPKTMLPQWSPDSKSLAYLKRENGITQAWQVDIEGGPAVAATHSNSDVEAITWSDDGDSIVYASRPGLLEQISRIQQEGLSGFLFDTRYQPVSGTTPMIPGRIEIQYTAIDRRTGAVRAATPKERAAIEPMAISDGRRKPIASVSGPSRAWTFALPANLRVETSSRDPAARYATTGLEIDTPKWKVKCQSAGCDRVLGVWVDDKAGRVIFMRRLGLAFTKTALFSWRYGDAAPREVFVTADNLVGCDLAPPGLICGQETPTQPRRLVLIDVRTGKTKPLLDPNPEFASIDLGQVISLQWTNDKGFEAFGRLVLPPHRAADERLPLIVVQYTARGFLRGGTGDEYPIHLFARNGFAVFAVNDPQPYNRAFPDTDRNDTYSIARRDRIGWAQRRNVQSSLEEGLRRVDSLGVVDMKRVGITGLSAGTASVQWALLHSKLFAAAAVSSCCDDEYASIVGSRRVAEQSRAKGSLLDVVDRDFYKDMSLAQNAKDINVPILMQASDTELLYSLPTVTALTALQKPVELYVFPDEFHNKWQSAHRAAVYGRNVDWFNFWLRTVRDPSVAKDEQYLRWTTLKEQMRNGASASNVTNP